MGLKGFGFLDYFVNVMKHWQFVLKIEKWFGK